MPQEGMNIAVRIVKIDPMGRVPGGVMTVTA